MGCFPFGGLYSKIKYIYNYIYFIPLFLLIIYRERIICYIYVILISIRVLYNIDWNFFVEHYTLDGSLLFMEGEGSEFPNNQGYEPYKASTGNEMQLGNSEPDVFIRDNATIISSKDLADWGVKKFHNFGHKSYTFNHNCHQMANLLEYQNAVYDHVYVNLHIDNNLILKSHASEFFEKFAEKHNVGRDPVSGKVPNTVELRNLFREQGNLYYYKKRSTILKEY